MIPTHLNNKKIILGSGSPRRAELLTILGLDYTKRVSDVEEIVPKDLPIREHAKYLSKLKATALQPSLTSDEILITADTTVIIEDQILNKPIDRADAIRMIQLMQGTHHEVITGLTVTDQQHQVSISDVAQVEVRPLSIQETSTYIDTWKPMDKAGAYGIQDWIGLAGITSITGSYYTIMGLPTHRLYDILKKWE